LNALPLTNTGTAPKTDYDVIIVGYGPVGAIAAAWMGLYGIHGLVIDKSEKVWDIPRAIALDHEIMRVFQNLGVVREVEPYTAPFPASQHYGVEGQLIRSIDAVSPPFPQGYTPTLVFTQPEVERVLREHVAKFSSIDVRLNVELVGLSQTSSQVVVELIDRHGSISTTTAQYLIACDGASSFVRQHCGLELEDLDFDEPWMVVDIVVDEHALPKLPATAAQYCNPARPTTFIVGPKNHRRWEIMLLPGEDPREMERPENVWHLLERWLEPTDGRLWRAGSYRFHALLAKEWRKGRILLAGDAAHQQPPFIGQGMCQGIRDVTNLAWKLVNVIRGDATTDLLDSYGEERKLHVHTLTSRIKAIGQHICERDPRKARDRDEHLIQQGGGVAPVVTRQEIVPPLASGFLARGETSGRGLLFPQPWIITSEGEKLLDDVTGLGWRLYLDGFRSDSTEFVARDIPVVVVGGCGLIERDGILKAWFKRHDCVATLVRPDHYVYGTANALQDVSKLTDELKMALEPRL
jgi:3-(3-hydroxy-phenyl)propionate hydroxylase